MSSVSPRDGEAPFQAPRPLPQLAAPPDGGGEGHSSHQRARSPGGHSPARKRMRVDLAGLSHSARVKRICEHRLTRLRQVSTACRDNMTELFFLSSQRNIIDMPGFRKKPSTEFVTFLKNNKAPDRVVSEVQTAVLGNFQSGQPEPRKHTYSPRLTVLPPIKVGHQQDVYNARAPPLPAPSRTLPPLPPPSAPSYTPDQLQEKVRQEGWVLRRVQDLARDGMWPPSRLPKVIEQPRPLAAWDMVLQEMKWMAADFQQERLWKQSAARVQAAAVKQFVADRNQRREEEAAELESHMAQRRIASSLSTQVKAYWNHVVGLHEYEVQKRHNLYLSNQLANQLGHVTDLQQDSIVAGGATTSALVTAASRKRKLDSGLGPGSSGRSSPVVADSLQSSSSSPTTITATENGGSGSCVSVTCMSEDEESTIEEQEDYERYNCVIENELETLANDAKTELNVLLRHEYPGALTDYLNQQPSAEDWEAGDYFGGSVESSDAECGSESEDTAPSHRVYSLHRLLPNNKERTSSGSNISSIGSGSENTNNKINGDLTRKDLIELSETAETHLPKSVISCNSTITVQTSPLFKGRLREYQTVAVQWLDKMYSAGLPAILADESGLGRKVVTAAFISNLVNSVQTKGPHILIVPSSSLHCWQRTFTKLVPGVRCSMLSPATMSLAQLHHLLSTETRMSSSCPHIFIATYKSFFQMPHLLTSTRWNVALLAEAQNLVAAGSPDQLRALAALTSYHRILIMTGPQKENPIDLWNVVHLLFPGVTGHESVDGSTCMVEGTSEYTQTVQRLQKLIAAFTLARTRHKHPGIEKQLSGPSQVPMYVNLSSRQKKLYDDYLAKPNTQEMVKGGDLSSVCSIVQQLRNICNHSSLVSSSSHFYPPCPPPRLEEVSPQPPRPLMKLLSESALDRVCLDNMNLVFLKQELSTTVLTSARLRSLKASRDLIQELADPTSTDMAKNARNRHFPPRVPTGKLTFTLEGITRTVNGWNVPGGWVEGMGLVKAGTGQVFKVCANPTPKSGTTSKARATTLNNLRTSTWLPGVQQLEVLKSIAEINQWRCSGFPLYGQDLIQSLTITNSIRPARSRFCGQGYINCFTEACRAAQQSSHLVQEKDDWRYRSSLLRPLLSIGTDAVQAVHSSVSYLTKLDTDPTFHSSKLQALCRVLEERYKNRERVIVILNSVDLIPTFRNFFHWKSYRCMVLRGDSNLEYLRCQLETFHLDSRYFVLTMVAFQTFAGLNIPSVGTVVEYDWTPLSKDLSTRGLTCPPNTIIRLICRGTLEESTSRRTLHTKIYTELDANTDSPCIKKQTLDELFRPSSDNGFLWMQDRKKKDKNQCKEEESGDLSQQVLALLGLACPDQTNTLLDLAELDCLDQDVDETPQYEDADLMAWLENIPAISRYGMRQLSESSNMCDKDGWSNHLSSEQQLQETRKKIEEDIARKGRKRKLEEESVEFVTYPSMLVNRQWKDDQGDLTYWKPPTYLDHIPDDTLTHLLYKTTPMPEEDLPPVHIKKEKKRDGQACNSLVSSPASSLPASPIDKPKIKREENVVCSAPRSIFDRPKQFKAIPRSRGVGIVVGTVGGNTSSNTSAQMSYMSNSGTLQGASSGIVASGSGVSLANNLTGKAATPADMGPEWLIQEDWALHQAVLSLQEMPLSLSAVSPAHISNWDLVADIVNSVSRCFRSARQCRGRYEATIQPREEGKLLYNDITPTKKQKKTKINIKGGQIQPPVDKKPSISKPMKTSVLFKQDNNNAWSSQFSHKFETIKSIANKRTPTTKPVLVNTTQRNPKHASVLAEWNVVNYDLPLGPAEVAANRVERLQRDKARTQQQQQQQLAAVQQQQQQNVVTVPGQQQVSVQQQSVQSVQQATPQQQIVATGHQTRLGVSNVSIPTAIVGSQGAVVSVNSSLPQAVVVSISQPVQQQQVLTSVGQITSVNNRPIVTQAVVSVSGVLPTNLQNSNAFTRLAGGQIIVSQAGKAVSGQTATRSPLTPAQIKILQAQSLQKQQQNRQRQMQLGSTSIATAVVNNTAVTTMTTSVVAGTAAITNSATRTIPGTSGIGRGQIVRPANVRSMSEVELKAILSKQQLKGVVQVAPGSLSAAQLQQLGISLAGQVGSSGAALVKTTGPLASVQQSTGATPITTTTIAVSQQMQAAQQQLQQHGKSVTIPLANLQGQQLKAVATGRGGTTVVAAQVAPGSGTTVTAQQLQQWRQLMARKGIQQNVALKQGGKLPTQLIVQGAGQPGKSIPAATMLQLQQIAKNVAGGSTVQIGNVGGTGSQQVQLSHTVLQAKPGTVQPGQTVQARVIPVSGTGGRGQQTIQVVAAGPAVQRTGSAVPNVTLDALSRQQGASAIASALAAGNHVKINAPGGATQQQILSQVTAALAGQAGQNVSVAVRTPASNQSIVTTQQLAARTVNTSGSSGQQSTTLVVNQPQQQLTLPTQQLVAAGSQVLASQAGVVSSQQQLLTSQQPQLISAQQLVSNQQQQLVVNQPQQQIVQTSQQQLVGGASQIQSSEST